MLISRSAISPPTITMAKGRCESDPIAWDMAAGNNPSVATSMVIMIGRSLRVAPSMAAALTGIPRARNWLMYSTMMTPVWTQTPNSARKPIPDETLKCVPVKKQCQKTTKGSHKQVYQVQQGPLEGAESSVNDHEDEEDVMGTIIMSRAADLFWLCVFALPVDVVTAGKLDPVIDLLNRLFDCASKVTATNAVLDGDIALVAFAVNFRSAIVLFDLAKLCQRYAFAAWRKQADVLNRLFLIPELLLIAQYQVISRLTLQDLSERITAHRSLDRILNVGYVDLIAGGLLAIHGDVQIGLAEHAENSQVLDAADLVHDARRFQ